MPHAGFEPAIPKSQQPQTQTLTRSANGIRHIKVYRMHMFQLLCNNGNTPHVKPPPSSKSYLLVTNVGDSKYDFGLDSGFTRRSRAVGRITVANTNSEVRFSRTV